MATVFPFPGNQSPKRENKEEKSLKGEIPKAYILEGVTGIGVGSEIVVDMMGNVYRGTLLAIKEKDANGNISKIIYTIHHLESGDPLKIGEAHFKYIVKNI